VSAGNCALRTDGTLACWGDNTYGQATPPAGTYTALSSGGGATCALKTDGTLACWGYKADALANPPRPAVTALPTWLASTAVPVGWSATPGIAAVTRYDVRYRRAAWNRGFGPYVTWRAGTVATRATFGASPGYTYAFSVRARDAAGRVSAWSAEKYTAVPLDDRSLSRSASWTRGTGSAYYRSTYLRSSTYGARLSRTGVVARRIALLATTCPTCGTVKVYWGSKWLKTVSLHSDRTVNRKLITVTTFTSARSGTLSVRVSSSGKRVIIDGVAIRRN
jgi:hypothetical protein